MDEGIIRERAEALGIVEAEGALLRARIHSEIWPILNDDQTSKGCVIASNDGAQTQQAPRLGSGFREMTRLASGKMPEAKLSDGDLVAPRLCRRGFGF